MFTVISNNISLKIDESEGVISSLEIYGAERLEGLCPIFVIRLRDKEGKCYYVDSKSAKISNATESKLTYKDFGGEVSSLEATIEIKAIDNGIEFYPSVSYVPSEYAIEWIELPKICLPRLIDNNPSGGKIAFPYDEGILLTDETLLPRYEMEFPMSGAYFLFPNKVCSQYMAYLFDSCGLYIGAHDKKRGFKGVDFYRYENGIAMQMRLYSGCDFGEGYTANFPVVWKPFKGDWQAAADIYRQWFKENLPSNLVPIKENKSLPKWYSESPLIVTYPVRGIHDMDKMEPNALFPYTNALPILKRIKNDTQCRIMALLMHWEGTAPWAPPYVWPPFGGVELFNKFRDELHKDGNLLGVYCSGFGYTKQSTLIESYNLEEKIKNEGVLKGVCHSPENKPELGITCCPYQRYGYDICPASEQGRKILDEAYSPLFDSGIDYAQILDQNHGGGQYMCYAREHHHPPMPGEWMTTNLQKLLKDYKATAPNMLFGCESAASEPFIGSLQMSDNRFELNYPYGTPIPMYAYVYHEFVRNFMGNQCGCPFEPKVDTLRYRLAYSFSIGDIMTLILSPSGKLMSHWGTHDFDSAPNMEKALTFIKNMREFYDNGGKEYLYCGKMVYAPSIKCESIEIPLFRGRKLAALPALPSACYEAENGKVAYIVINPDDKSASFSIENEHYEIKPLDAMLIIK